MKCSIFLLIAGISCFLLSCKKQPVALSENSIRVNNCRTFEEDGKKLTCCLDSVIQESRCPVDALCVWQGIAVARFVVNSQNKEDIITLATTKFAMYNKDTAVAGFKIELVNLLPYGESGKPIHYEEYTAIIKITKL